MKKTDNKYFHTANLMHQAILILLEKKDIEFITVTEITKKAGVNRSTFYLHYENIYELFEETVSALNQEFINSFTASVPFQVESPNTAFLLTEEYLTPYLIFCKKNRRILKLVHQKPHLFKNDNAYQKMYDKIFYPAISQFIKDETQKVYNLEFFTQGVVGIIKKWLALDCVTEIDELIAVIKNCVGYQQK